jgi:4-alpha-glucanotransferase/(1->4)-alpha-D-glucan 1-alpha-D-glucosylmutase
VNEHERLERLAARWGIEPTYIDVWGRAQRAPDSTLLALLRAMGAAPEAVEAQDTLAPMLPPAVVLRGATPPLRIPLARPCRRPLAWCLVAENGAIHTGTLLPSATELVIAADLGHGYHRLILAEGEREAATTLILAPRRCYCPPALAGDGRLWGPAVQLYGLRSARNWGIGDFTDLAAVVDAWGAAGAGLVGVNPLHALFPADPAKASPYSPSSRLFRNLLYLDVEAIADFAECEAARSRVATPGFQARLAALRAAELVDYPGVAAAKFEILELLHAHFREHHLACGSPRAEDFRRYRQDAGAVLSRHALFEALQAHFLRADPALWGWPVWPAAYRDPDSAAVRRFAEEHAERVGFFEYLQWQAELQVAAAASRAARLGCALGLYQDLAVSVDPGGAEAWAGQRRYAVGASVGAPPDEYNPGGQDWGLPPPNPQALLAAGYAPFIATLRANMRHAGALRIDHVMGLAHLFWVPAGATPAEGAYVRYPLDALLGVLALESQRERCLVVGEDLGTVPEALRAALAEAGVLSYRVLYFERGPGGEFTAPDDYLHDAVVTPTTHDLPTLAGWWEGRDLAVRAELGLYPDEAQHQAQVAERAADRARLLAALAREGRLPASLAADPAQMSPALARAIFGYLAATPSALLVLPLEDVAGEREQANLPGTVDQHPNWRRKLALAVEEMAGEGAEEGAGEGGCAALVATLVGERGRSAAGPRPSVLASIPSALAPIPCAARIPRATYRLQLHRDFGFVAATALVPYLAALGVSHVYCSPLLAARPGSRHGYDIIDHARLNAELGDEAAFEGFVVALRAHDMALMMDLVPNHMAVLGADNAWWLDVLEHGPASAFAGYFDIDWQPPDPALAGKVLLPVLADHYGRVLEGGAIRLAFEPAAGSFALIYYEYRFPLDPRSYPLILDGLCEAGKPDVAGELARLAAAFARLPPRDAGDLAAARRRDAALLRARLAALVAAEPPLAAAIVAAVAEINGRPDERASFDALDALIEAQAYRLANWRTAADEINYRRFFDINELAALRMEEPAVFEATHRHVLALAAAGKVDALRIDHPDGLADPADYFARLQDEFVALAVGAASGREHYPMRTMGSRPEAAPTDAAPTADPRPLYVVIEKILAPHEDLPAEWAVQGTTGYRFLNLAGGLFVDGAAGRRIDRCWRGFVGAEAGDFDQAAYEAKRTIMAEALAAELTMLANALLGLARADRRSRDFTLNTLRQALAEVVARLPVYRTYIATGLGAGPSAQDRRYVEWALAQASRRGTGDESLFAFLRAVLLQEPTPDASPQVEKATAAAYRRFVRRFQQFTGAVAAKGIEDTAFYRYNRLLAVNEVGGRPDPFGITVAAFHGASAARAADWPHTLLATSTHDNKRSEDVRCRIAVLSEMPGAWRLALRRWNRLNRSRRQEVDGAPAPSRNDEYLFYQTLLGSFPAEAPDAEELAAYRTRMAAYMEKAVREAKRHTSWIRPAADYERAVAAFVDATLGQLDGNPFLADFLPLARQVAWFGAWNSLSLTLLKLASPGVPDFYQGNEMLDFSLVDPDNRRPVDYALRRLALDELRALKAAEPAAQAAGLAELAHHIHDGRLKLWVTWRALELRREQEALLSDGDYLAVEAGGAAAGHVVAFARRHGNAGIIAVAGRLFASLGVAAEVLPVGAAAWGDTRLDLAWLPAGTRLTDALSGRRLTTDAAGGLPVAQIFGVLPVALLCYEES